MTVEQLLCHRSGIGDYLDEDAVDSNDYPMPISVHRLVTTQDFLQVLDGFPTKFGGTRFSYCNGGYVVLALLAERASAARAPRPRARRSRARDDRHGLPRSDALPGCGARLR